MPGRTVKESADKALFLTSCQPYNTLLRLLTRSHHENKTTLSPEGLLQVTNHATLGGTIVKSATVRSDDLLTPTSNAVPGEERCLPSIIMTTDYRLQTTDYRLQTADYELQTTDYRVQSSDYVLRYSLRHDPLGWRRSFSSSLRREIQAQATRRPNTGFHVTTAFGAAAIRLWSKDRPRA